MSKYAIGVDFGTESSRAILADVADGRQLATAVSTFAHGVVDERLPLPDRDIPLPPDWALHAGGSHHTSFGFDVTPDQLGNLAAMCGIELVLIDERTRLDELRAELGWSDLYWQVAKAL